MSQALLNSIGSNIFTVMTSLIAAVGIAILYVRYLRRLRIPAHERTGVHVYGLLIIGVIAIVIGLSGTALLFYTHPAISTIVVFVLSLLVFTGLYVFVVRRSYKKSL